ncbi:MAG: hypothetical protein RL489_1888 [Pseudomonadota bacterium]
MRYLRQVRAQVSAPVSIQPGYPPGMRSDRSGHHRQVRLVSIQPGYPPGMRSLGSPRRCAARRCFNPTRLSAGNEIARICACEYTGAVSIQPGYPPGMRSGAPAWCDGQPAVSIQPGYPPGMRCLGQCHGLGRTRRFNPTRLSAGNEMADQRTGCSVEPVSIQPGYPPGMRSASRTGCRSRHPRFNPTRLSAGNEIPARGEHRRP